MAGLGEHLDDIGNVACADAAIDAEIFTRLGEPRRFLGRDTGKEGGGEAGVDRAIERRGPCLLDYRVGGGPRAEVTVDRAGIEAGTEELVPADVGNAPLDGANPVRVWRKHRGMSAKVLAEKAGIAPAYLSQIETGRREGTIETMRRIAIALDLTLGDLAG